MITTATRVWVSDATGGLGARVLRLFAAAESIAVAGGDVNGLASSDVIVWLSAGDADARAERKQSAMEGLAAALADATNARHVVLVSSAMVYGAWANNPVPLTEEAPLRPDVDFVYARQLGAAEQLVDDWRLARADRSVTVLRPVVTMAAEGTSGLASALAAGMGQRRGEADPPSQYLHLDDLASAVALSAQRLLDGVFNVAPDGAVPGERVRALAGSAAPEAARAGYRSDRHTALAFPARADPARPAQLHTVDLAGCQRSPQSAGLAADGHQRAGVRRGHREIGRAHV